MKLIILFCTLLLSSVIQAQILGSVVRSAAVKAAVGKPVTVAAVKAPVGQPAAVAAATQPVKLPRYQVPVPFGRGAVEAAAGTQYRHAVSTASLAPVAGGAARSYRPWLMQQFRNMRAWQLKEQHTARLQALAAQEQFRQNLEKRLLTLPQPTGKQFRVEHFGSFSQSVPQAVPALPLLAQPGYLYRGLGLPADGAALANILTQGLLLKDVGPSANNLLTAWGGDRASLSEYKQLSTTQVTNLTKHPIYAAQYALTNSQTPGKIPVIVAVTGIAQYDEVVRVYEDIPASQINAVFALLEIDGTPTWCRVEQVQDKFLITPYEIK